MQKTVDKVSHLCYIKVMINEKINKRITVTLPQILLTRLNKYCCLFGYVRFSTVIRLSIEEYLDKHEV